MVAGGVIWWSWNITSKITDSEPLVIPKTELKNNQPIDTSTWKTYRNEKYGFEVKYPEDFTINERLGGGEQNPNAVYFRSKSDDFFIKIDNGYQEVDLLPFKDYAMQISKNACDADGPSSSMHCEEISELSPFNDIRVAPAYEIYLNEIIQMRGKSNTQRTKGPIIAIDISIHTQGLTRGLFINLQGSSNNEEMIKKIAATFKFIE